MHEAEGVKHPEGQGMHEAEGVKHPEGQYARGCGCEAP